MLDFTSTQPQAKEVAPPASREGGQDEATTAKPLNAPPLLTTDGVDKMYHHLAEIHTITTEQLAECAQCCWSDSTPNLVWAGTSRPRPVVTPFTIRLAPSPPTDFSSQAMPWQWWGRHDERQVLHEAHQGSTGTLPKHRV
jgi:hypothetical protein